MKGCNFWVTPLAHLKYTKRLKNSSVNEESIFFCCCFISLQEKIVWFKLKQTSFRLKFKGGRIGLVWIESFQIKILVGRSSLAILSKKAKFPIISF